MWLASGARGAPSSETERRVITPRSDVGWRSLRTINRKFDLLLPSCRRLSRSSVLQAVTQRTWGLGVTRSSGGLRSGPVQCWRAAPKRGHRGASPPELRAQVRRTRFGRRLRRADRRTRGHRPAAVATGGASDRYDSAPLKEQTSPAETQGARRGGCRVAINADARGVSAKVPVDRAQGLRAALGGAAPASRPRLIHTAHPLQGSS